MKKVLSIVLVIALVVVGILAINANNTNKDLTKQVEELQASVSEYKETVAEYEKNLTENAQTLAANEESLAQQASDAAALNDEQNARVAELEAQVASMQELLDTYYPYYEAQIVVAYDGGNIFREDVLADYQYYEDLYSQYGITLEGSGYDTQIKQNLLQSAAAVAVRLLKAEQLGLTLDEDDLALVEQNTNDTLESYISQGWDYFAEDGMTDDEVRQSIIDYLESMDYGYDQMYEEFRINAILEKLYNYAIADVAVTDEEIKAAYDEQLAADKEAYTTAYAYETAVNNGTSVFWNLENYITVKQVLIKFDDDQSTRYTEITGRISDLEAELETVLAAEAEAAEAVTEETTEEATEEATEETTEETTEEATEEATDEATEETAEAVRTSADVQADLDAANAELDALYEELLPRAEEVVEKFNAGTGIDELIAEYGEDPGMTSEPTMTTGYVVCKDYSPYKTDDTTRYTVWDTAFAEAAATIPEIGQLSEPTRGMYGYYILYHLADVPAGEVALESVQDTIRENLYAEKAQDVYNDAVDQWLNDFNVVYYLENF